MHMSLHISRLHVTCLSCSPKTPCLPCLEKQRNEKENQLVPPAVPQRSQRGEKRHRMNRRKKPVPTGQQNAPVILDAGCSPSPVICRRPSYSLLQLLLLRDDDAPLVLLTTVHDVEDPALDFFGDLASLALRAHGDVDILATVVDL